VIVRKSRDRSAPVVVSVKFMELRPRMCRWPIGDPQHFETIRFCGCACPSEASYCKEHNAIAHPPSRPGTARKMDFQMRAWVA
jgi:GcrA cell cycle regulator